MRAVASLVLALVVAVFADPARATEHGSCGLIQSVTQLPAEADRIRTEGGDPAEFKAKINRVIQSLGDEDQTAVFSREEMRAMRIFVGAVREDWKLNGLKTDGRKIPGLTVTSTTISTQLDAITSKFGCAPPRAYGDRLRLSFEHGPVSPLALILMIAALFVAAIVAYKVMLSRQPMERKLCHVAGFLHYDGLSASTVVKDISRGGVMVELPDDTFQAEKAVVSLAGYQLPSIVAWRNSNFAGLKFEKTQSARVVEAILTSPEAQIVPPCAETEPAHHRRVVIEEA